MKWRMELIERYKLLKYNKGAKSELTKDIELGISTAKGRKPWEVEYMTLYDEIRMQRKQAHREGLKQGIEQGMSKARFEDVEALVTEGTFTAEKACEILGVSYEDYLRERRSRHGFRSTGTRQL